MPRLTQIKETKKGRLALFFDGEFAFSLDENTFADAGLHQDDDLEEWQIEELRKKSETRRALDKAMDYLALRDHAAGELYQKLCRKFDAHSAAYAVARAGELGLLNDAGFARRRAAELLRKRKSRREILNDLSAKGIDRDTAAEVVEELFAEGEDGEKGIYAIPGFKDFATMNCWDVNVTLLEKYGFAVAKMADGESFGPVRADSPRWIFTAVKQYTQEVQ